MRNLLYKHTESIQDYFTGLNSGGITIDDWKAYFSLYSPIEICTHMIIVITIAVLLKVLCEFINKKYINN